ncbi:FecR family protein [Spirosoma endophyticum]|uniref:FecR family protein n=1 Tax=Spirosoma endophyticum TaxID=662367 RepID=A0A1I2GIQ2_9BACT|nr:FecR family protein [Spirosoma endophyticum]SFF17372.1 FecR family protein [Spirosoma endophyticum]
MLEKYATYDRDDFVQDGEFIRWVKYPDPKNDLFWSSLLDIYPFQQDTIMQARQIVLKLSAATCNDVSEQDVDSIWQNLQLSIGQPVKVIPLWQRAWVRMAAAVFLLVGGLAVWQLLHEETNLVSISRDAYGVLSGNLTQVSNNTTDSMIIKLPDNSRITLSRGAKLRYKTHFTDSIREVYLTGEAFFEVARNPQKPFIVYTSELITKVLGTSFWIKTNVDDKHITVAVKTGKVFVYKKTKGVSADQFAGVVLLPNQQTDYKPDSDKLSRTLVEEPLPVLPDNERQASTFDNVPVTELLDNLEKSYGVDIQFDRSVLTGCRLTTSFKDESLFQRLEVLCEAINATYKLEETRIVINAQRCL